MHFFKAVPEAVLYLSYKKKANGSVFSSVFLLLGILKTHLSLTRRILAERLTQVQVYYIIAKKQAAFNVKKKLAVCHVNKKKNMDSDKIQIKSGKRDAFHGLFRCEVR